MARLTAVNRTCAARANGGRAHEGRTDIHGYRMTIRNLDALLKPKSVALIGASARPGSVGNTVARNLLAGGFQGAIDFVNPKGEMIGGKTCVGALRDIASPPDLAVIATPAATVPRIVADLAAAGTRAAVIVTAGITGALRSDMLNAARTNCLRILGPNCIGLLVPPIGLNASFAQRLTKAGKLAFVSQSGALVTAVIDWAGGQDIGFSHIASIGDMADVDLGDLLDYLAGDPGCSAILLYIEAVTAAQKFMSAARRAARVKPVIVLKSGRHASAAQAAHSHTGALAGSDAAYDAAFQRAGVLRVLELYDLFSAAEMVAHAPLPHGERLAILTNGGGAGVLAADCLADMKGTLARPAAETMAALDGALPSTWSRGNPVDIIGDADGERYRKAMEILLADPASDALLVINCPTALSSSTDIAESVVAAVAKPNGKTVITNWLGDSAARPARRLFSANHIPTFETPQAAINGFMQLVRHERAQAALMQTPPRSDAAYDVDRTAANSIIAAALAAGRPHLSEAEGKALLSAYGIPVVETHIAATPAEARSVAERLLARGGSVALKILSDDISHKSDVGGVKLALPTAEAVEVAAEAMLAHIRQVAPKARLSGFTVSTFVDKPRAHELILGIVEDKTFGPLVMFGAGGVSVEVTADTTLALPPLDLAMAKAMIGQTRVSRLLQGYRARPRADIDAIADALVRLAALAANHPEIRELDVNPLLADEAGVIALDARVRIADDRISPRVPMAIRPYPSEWQKTDEIDGIGRIRIRPIRPDDEALYQAFFDKVTMEDRRLRLFTPMAHLTHGFLARLTQIDYAREIAFVAIDVASGDLLGVVRFFADPDYTQAEYAVLVRSDLKGRGLGWRLMTLLIDYARSEKLHVLTGAVLEENTTMIRMCEELGFTRTRDSLEHGVWQMRLDLRTLP